MTYWGVWESFVGFCINEERVTIFGCNVDATVAARENWEWSHKLAMKH